MPLLRKQPFIRNKPPVNIKGDHEIFFCEATKEMFLDYDQFFQRTILCNSLVWSCSITGKSNLTFEEATESEHKARKRIGNLPKSLKKGILWLAAHTKRGRMNEVADDVHEFTKQRYFKGEIVEAVINDQWCDAKVARVIPPTQQEIDKDNEDDDDEICEVDENGSPTSPKKDNNKPKGASVPDHLFKYEVEEVEPEDEDMVVIRVIPAEDVKREKGVFSRDKLNLYLKNVLELDGTHYKVKEKCSKMYDLESVRFEDIFAGPAPQFMETQRKNAILNKKKKGQFTLDGWIKEERVQQSKNPEKQVVQKKKQTPEELEAEMQKMRERQARYKEEMKAKMEEEKRKRADFRAREKERKKEEQKIAKELMASWARRRDDLECEDLKELPKPSPVHCHIPNNMFGEFMSILEFLNSFTDTLALKDNYPGGLTFAELEDALTEKEVPDGSFFDILSFMLITLFELQIEETEEAKADSDKSVLEETDRNVLGKDEEVAEAIKAATETSNYTKKNLGIALKDCHMDIWSLTEILRLHLESSGAFRGHNLQNWRYQQRGGYRLTDDPGYQFCRDEPQILASLQKNTVCELSIGDKLKILSCLMAQMLTYAGVRDEIDTRMDNMIEAAKDVREAVVVENRRIREQEAEEKRERKEEKNKKKEETLKEAINKNPEEKKEIMTDRQKEAIKVEEERKEKEKTRREELKRSEFLDKERELQNALINCQNQVYVHCLGRDRAYRRYWTFHSLPAIFVEHNDDEIGPCLEEGTPWNPAAGPISEEEAFERAKEILSKTDENSELTEHKLAEITQTYSKKPPTLKQQTLNVNGSIKEKEESKDGEEKKEGEEKMETDEAKETATEEQKEPCAPWGICVPDTDVCVVHSTILPKTRWSFFSSIEELDSLIDSLNPRGYREGELRERLIAEREELERKLKRAGAVAVLKKTDDDLEKEMERKLEALQKQREKNKRYGGALALPVGTKLTDMLEISLRDQILELEEKIFIGSLGNLQVKDREAWQNAMQTRQYIMSCDEIAWGGEHGGKLTQDMLEAESRAGTPDSSKRSSTGSAVGPTATVVKQLAAAIIQIGQMINDTEKFLKAPLGEDEKDKKRRQREEEKRKKEREAEEDEGVICEDKETTVPLTPIQRWECSLMAATNLGQLALHLTTFDNSVIWSKSIMNTKCRLCRRKTDPDKMLLCDGCDRGHHLYCLKPKLKSIPSGDWYCSDCKPKERVRSPKKKVRRVFSSTEESEGEEDDVRQDEDKQEKNEDGSGMEDDEEDEDYGKSKKNVKAKAKKAKKKLELEEASPEPAKKKKKGGIANLLGGKRRAANAGEEKRRDAESEEEEQQQSEDEEEIVTSRSRKGNKKKRLEVEEKIESDEEEIVTSRSRRGNNTKKKKPQPVIESEEEYESEEESKARNKRGSRKSKQDENKENARSKRRREQEDDIELQFNSVGLEDLLKGMMKHKDGWPFDRPITKSDAPDYHKIVKTPMDLGTIKSGLNRMKYSCNQEVLDHVRLVFKNCYQYNMDDTEEYMCAKRLEKYFDKEISKMGLSEEPVQKASKRGRRTF